MRGLCRATRPVAPLQTGTTLEPRPHPTGNWSDARNVPAGTPLSDESPAVAGLSAVNGGAVTIVAGG